MIPTFRRSRRQLEHRGLTDLELLGPACQFHDRDRYPDRYTRRKAGKDRWAFTYHRLAAARR